MQRVVVMSLRIHKDAIGKYAEYLKDPELLSFPAGHSRSFNLAEHSVKNQLTARQQIVTLLRAAFEASPAVSQSLDDQVYSEFVVTSHAEAGFPPGWEWSEEKKSSKRRVQKGQAPMMLTPEGAKAAMTQYTRNNAANIVITSLSPRAIHHALLKYVERQDITEKLDDIAQGILQGMERDSTDPQKEKVVQLSEIALNHGIIPTVLLNSHFQGPMDLMHAVPDEKRDIDSLAQSEYYQRLYPTLDIETRSRELHRLFDSLKDWQDPLNQVRDENGSPISENLPQYLSRVYELVSLFFPRGEFYQDVGGRRVNFVGHSSSIDVISAIFASRGQTRLVLGKAEKSKTQAKEKIIKVDKDLVYLNNPGLLEPLNVKARSEITALRSRSMDNHVQRGEHILHVPLVGFSRTGKKNGEFIPHPEILEDVLGREYPAIQSGQGLPILIFGHGGQGKTILATEIARKLLDGKFGEKYAKYVPVLFNGEDIVAAAGHNMQSEGGKPRMERILEARERGSLEHVVRDGYRFAFIVDDYQKIHNEKFVTDFRGRVKELCNDGHLVIILSREERSDVHPPDNPGYLTLKIDSDGISEQIGEFTQGRVPEGQEEAFHRYLSQYDPSITGSNLAKLFLTLVFPGSEQHSRVTSFVVRPELAGAITRGEPLSIGNLYEAYTDFVTACDIIKLNPQIDENEIKPEITSWKRILAQHARDLVTEQRYNNPM